MLPLFDSLRDLNVVSVLVRMLLSTVCGGLIGAEREYKRRPAGFRTHILICLGAAVTTLTGQYLVLVLHANTDMARLGAQVIAGVGFIGAGTIVVTRRRRVKGLTTAAGLWTAAIVGLAVGAGDYEAALCATGLILLAEMVFSKLEYRLVQRGGDLRLYVEYRDKAALDAVLACVRRAGAGITDLEISRAAGTEPERACAVFTLRMSRRTDQEKLVGEVAAQAGVLAAEEL